MLAAATSGCSLALAGDADDECVAQVCVYLEIDIDRCMQPTHERGADDECVAQAAANGEALARAARASSTGALALRPEGSLAPWHCVERRYAALPAAGGVTACVWSAASLPLRTASVDVVCVDLPFGKAHKVRGGGLAVLYAKTTLECARVLRPGGRLVMLTTSRKSLAAPLAAQAAVWEEIEARNVNCGGALAWVLLWRRTGTRLTAEVAAAAGRREPSKKARARAEWKAAQQGASAEPPSVSDRAHRDRGARGGVAASGAPATAPRRDGTAGPLPRVGKGARERGRAVNGGGGGDAGGGGGGERAAGWRAGGGEDEAAAATTQAAHGSHGDLPGGSWAGSWVGTLLSDACECRGPPWQWRWSGGGGGHEGRSAKRPAGVEWI